MKIIALRHGFRFDSALYFTPLTATGLEQADNLVEILKDEKIDTIYCSPFLRTLQTIYPYCIENNKKVNVQSNSVVSSGYNRASDNYIRAKIPSQKKVAFST